MALRNLKQQYPDIVYICIGYGDEEHNLKKLVQELDLNSQVMFFKDISNDLKNALLAKSDIFVMPSIIHKKSVEGFGIAYVEAAQHSSSADAALLGVFRWCRTNNGKGRWWRQCDD